MSGDSLRRRIASRMHSCDALSVSFRSDITPRHLQNKSFWLIPHYRKQIVNHCHPPRQCQEKHYRASGKIDYNPASVSINKEGLTLKHEQVLPGDDTIFVAHRGFRGINPMRISGFVTMGVVLLFNQAYYAL